MPLDGKARLRAQHDAAAIKSSVAHASPRPSWPQCSITAINLLRGAGSCAAPATASASCAACLRAAPYSAAPRDQGSLSLCVAENLFQSAPWDLARRVSLSDIGHPLSCRVYVWELAHKHSKDLRRLLVERHKMFVLPIRAVVRFEFVVRVLVLSLKVNFVFLLRRSLLSLVLLDAELWDFPLVAICPSRDHR